VEQDGWAESAFRVADGFGQIPVDRREVSGRAASAGDLSRHCMLSGNTSGAAADADGGCHDILLVGKTPDGDDTDATDTDSAQRSCCVPCQAALYSAFCLDQADPSRPLMS
jgi:hypothetical protein